jgi:hypothetical protein
MSNSYIYSILTNLLILFSIHQINLDSYLLPEEKEPSSMVLLRIRFHQNNNIFHLFVLKDI